MQFPASLLLGFSKGSSACDSLGDVMVNCDHRLPMHLQRLLGSSTGIVSANPINNEQSFSDAALRHWEMLGRELRGDVESFNRDQRGSASFDEVGHAEYRVRNLDSGLEARITADAENHIVRYGFVRMNENSAGVPEGGILSMRLGLNGVEFYSADRPVTASEARRLLLDPVLSVPGS